MVISLGAVVEGTAEVVISVDCEGRMVEDGTISEVLVSTSNGFLMSQSWHSKQSKSFQTKDLCLPRPIPTTPSLSPSIQQEVSCPRVLRAKALQAEPSFLHSNEQSSMEFCRGLLSFVRPHVPLLGTPVAQHALGALGWSFSEKIGMPGRDTVWVIWGWTGVQYPGGGEPAVYLLCLQKNMNIYLYLAIFFLQTEL